MRADFGSNGEDTPWAGSPAAADAQRFAISAAQWQNFTLGLAPEVCRIYSAVANVSVIWNAGGGGGGGGGTGEGEGRGGRLAQLVAACPPGRSFIRAGVAAHDFQVNDEFDSFGPAGAGTLCHTEGLHCCAESWPFSQSGYVRAVPLWSAYAHLMWLLRFGVDMPGLSAASLADPAFQALYQCFNTFAHAVRPPAAALDAAILVLRDGALFVRDCTLGHQLPLCLAS
eukprot:SAG22_NODE_939_length_6404_cov_3.836003_1_plen_227_part_00